MCKKIYNGHYRTTYAWNSTHRMITGVGGRRVARYIKFPVPFTNKPQVLVAFSLMDVYKGINNRISCWASYITRHGFYLYIGTWADSKIYGARCNYLAHGY